LVRNYSGISPELRKVCKPKRGVIGRKEGIYFHLKLSRNGVFPRKALRKLGNLVGHYFFKFKGKEIGVY